MWPGERRLAERLEAKLEDDYLVWFDIPIGSKQTHPDFVLLHPDRGILILEVKDWNTGTILRMDRSTCEILDHGVPKTVVNPLEQARHYAHAVVDALQRDAQLVHPVGSARQGQLLFPWSYGVVFPNLTRDQFDKGELGNAIEPSRVICSDEMLKTVEVEG